MTDQDAEPWGLIGQQGAVATLARVIDQGRNAHAYLFSGPPGAGKATLARRTGQLLECLDRQRDASGLLAPCGACRACRHVEDGKHPDVETIAPGGLCDEREHDHRTDNSKDIKICQVRALEHRLSLSPFEGRYRVITVDPADSLNVYAADAFLKTLEEPPPQVVMLLLSARPEMLPETVRSRLHTIEVAPVPVPALEAALQRRGADAKTAALVARLSRGCAGWALNALAQPALLQERAALLDELIPLGTAPRYERFAFAAELAARWTRDRRGVGAVLSVWSDWWRDVLIAAAGSERGILNRDRIEQVRSAAIGVTVADAAQCVLALRAVQGQLDENANPRLALEVFMLRLPEARAPRA